ncbi:MAG: general secretion pathway protein GspB [Xanthomonadaceae bacterium]|nr:general secretion pathway protein GspB [Xanthomonadaceae bacterium]
MSLLLDALRKSEAQRQRGQAPSLELASMPSSIASPARRFPWLAILLVVLGAILAIWVVSRWSEYESSAPVDPIVFEADLPKSEPGTARLADSAAAATASGPVPAARMRPVALDAEEMLEQDSTGSRTADQAQRATAIEQPASAVATVTSQTSGRDPAVTDAADSAAVDVERVAQVAPRPAPDRVVENSAASSEPADPDRDQAARASQGRAQASTTGRPESRSADSASNPGASRSVRDQGQSMQQNFIRPWELPQDQRASFPDLKMTVHFYADRVQDRFVLINGTRYGQGDSITDRALLKEVSRQGAIVEYGPYRILIE